MDHEGGAKPRLLTSTDLPDERDATCDPEATIQSAEPPGRSAASHAVTFSAQLFENKPNETLNLLDTKFKSTRSLTIVVHHSPNVCLTASNIVNLQLHCSLWNPPASYKHQMPGNIALEKNQGNNKNMFFAFDLSLRRQFLK